MQNIGGLYAAFPLAYAVVLPALYAPLIVIVFRGVAFEFRWRAGRERFAWDWAFAGGSALAALYQGIALGALLQGTRVNGRAYAGGVVRLVDAVQRDDRRGADDWLCAPRCVLARDEDHGRPAGRARRFAFASGLGTVTLIGVVSLRTPLPQSGIHESLVRFSGNLYTLPVPLAVASAACST
jgi:cytochrome d ubiquinol oxidase subunit II